MAAVSASAEDHPRQTPDCGTIDRVQLFSPQMADTMIVDIWLPDGYAAEPGQRYPVIYMHDGQNLFDASTTWNRQAWEIDSVMCALVAQESLTPAIVVGVHSFSPTRVADLMPENAVKGEPLQQTLRAVGMDAATIRGNAYCDFLVQTLKPYVDERYRTLPDMRHTSVMGSSMGGLMSIYALCEHPDVFGNALCLSTHWIGTPDHAEEFADAMYHYIDAKLPEASADPTSLHKLYFDHGTETLDAFYGPSEEKILTLVKSKGYGPGTLLNLIDTGGAHDERSWARRVAIPLRFALTPTP